MGLGGCGPAVCDCAFESETLVVEALEGGIGWKVEQVEFEALAAIEAAIANLEAAMNLLPGSYVAKAGDQMTGSLRIVSSGGGLYIVRTDAELPYLDFLRNADGTSIAYVQGDDVNDLLTLAGRTGIGVRILVDGAVEALRALINGTVLVGKTAAAVATTGNEIAPSGQYLVTRAAVGENFRSNKTSVADVNGGVHLRVDSAGTLIGSITRATASTTAFNTSSDETWKTNIFEIDDDLAEYWARLVQPMFFEFIRSPGDVHAGYIAQRVAAVWPEAISLGVVTPGYGTQDDRTWDEDGNETTPDDVYRQWMIDLSKMVPFVHAAWQATDRKVTKLDQRVTTLETRVDALAA